MRVNIPLLHKMLPRLALGLAAYLALFRIIPLADLMHADLSKGAEFEAVECHNASMWLHSSSYSRYQHCAACDSLFIKI
jgi:hypothetical protein